MRNYLDTLAQHKLRAIILILLIPGSVAAGGFFYLQSYLSQASFWAENQTIGVQTTANLSAVQTASQQSTEQLYELLQTRTFVEDLAKGAQYPGQKPDGSLPDRVVSEIRHNLNVSWSGPHIVTISFRDDDPELSARVVSSTLHLFRDTVLRFKREDATLAVSFYQNQLEQYRTELTRASEELRAFKEKYPAPTDPKVSRPPAQEQELTRLENQYEQASTLYDGALHRLDDARLTSAAQVQEAPSSFRIMDQPRVPRERTTDIKKLSVAALAALCLAIAMVLILALVENWTNDSLRSRHDASMITDLPVIGCLPYMDLRRKGRKAKQKRAQNAIYPEPLPSSQRAQEVR